MVKIIFFGSTSDSVLVLDKLPHQENITIAAIVTQPAKPIGRKQVITPTKTEVWAKAHDITVLSFPAKPDRSWEYENEQTVIDTLQPMKADMLISASYGQKIPSSTIEDAKFGGLNVHPSILPRWRGADPVPWAILSGDRQIGVTVVTLSSTFDKGRIIAQKKIPITDKDTSVPLRGKLFAIGAELLITSLPDYLSGKTKGVPQKIESQPYARRFKREDGFEPWESLTDPKNAQRMKRKLRALDPWPGLWTQFHEKRLKILKFDATPMLVQLEGKKPILWEQFKTAYIPS